ncbi:MAG: aromatic ring-hydroxylating dioxygenase subunit alpha [Alphaproteobacteria bacterium]
MGGAIRTRMRNKQWAEKYPELGTGPVPAEPCILPEYFELERERVFRRTWINVCRVDDVPEPGDFFVRDLVVCKASLLIIRGKDNVIRGFHNVCSHRGNIVSPHERGNCATGLFCPFHNWRYDDKGALVGVPDEENFFNLDKARNGLTPVNLDVWGGFVFVHLDPQPAQSLRDYLGGVAAQLDGCPFDEMRCLQTYKVEERTNWKIALDAQNEVYHLPFQHQRLIGHTFMLNEQKHTRILEVKLFERHTVWSCEFVPNYKLSPLEQLLGRIDKGEEGVRIPQLIGEFDFYVVFPNMVIIPFRGPMEDGFATYNFWPLAYDRTIWEIRYYFPPAKSAGRRISQEFFKCLIRDVQQEDSVAHEALFTGLASRAKTHLQFQDEEITIRYFHKVLEDHVGYYRNRSAAAE